MNKVAVSSLIRVTGENRYSCLLCLVSCVMLVEMPGHDDVVMNPTVSSMYVGIVPRESKTSTIKLPLYCMPAVAVYQRLGASRAPHRYLYPGDV